MPEAVQNPAAVHAADGVAAMMKRDDADTGPTRKRGRDEAGDTALEPKDVANAISATGGGAGAEPVDHPPMKRARKEKTAEQIAEAERRKQEKLEQQQAEKQKKAADREQAREEKRAAKDGEKILKAMERAKIREEKKAVAEGEKLLKAIERQRARDEKKSAEQTEKLCKARVREEKKAAQQAEKLRKAQAREEKKKAIEAAKLQRAKRAEKRRFLCEMKKHIEAEEKGARWVNVSQDMFDFVFNGTDVVTVRDAVADTHHQFLEIKYPADIWGETITIGRRWIADSKHMFRWHMIDLEVVYQDGTLSLTWDLWKVWTKRGHNPQYGEHL